MEQLETLVQQPPEAIEQFLADAVGASGGLYFENPQEAEVWLHRFRTHMLLVLSQKQ